MKKKSDWVRVKRVRKRERWKKWEIKVEREWDLLGNKRMNLSFFSFNEGMYRETFFASLLFLQPARFLLHLFFALNSFAKSQLFFFSLIIFCWIFCFLNAQFSFSVCAVYCPFFWFIYRGSFIISTVMHVKTDFLIFPRFLFLFLMFFGICIMSYIHTIFLVNFMNMRQRFMFHMDTWIRHNNTVFLWEINATTWRAIELCALNI